MPHKAGRPLSTNTLQLITSTIPNKCAPYLSLSCQKKTDFTLLFGKYYKTEIELPVFNFYLPTIPRYFLASVLSAGHLLVWLCVWAWDSIKKGLPPASTFLTTLVRAVATGQVWWQAQEARLVPATSSKTKTHTGFGDFVWKKKKKKRMEKHLTDILCIDHMLKQQCLQYTGANVIKFIFLNFAFKILIKTLRLYFGLHLWFILYFCWIEW
jgi:hypothetical protein